MSETLPAGYRLTELGPLPEEWRVVRLGEAGKIVTGKTPPTSNDEYWDGTIPFITPVDLEGEPIVRASRTISKKGLTKTKPLTRSSVLVSCIGYIGKTGLIDADLAATNQQINAIIPHEEIASSFYLLYLLTYLAPNLAARARMTTLPILSKSGLSAFPIPLPPLAEQRAIAHVLRTVQEAKEATARVIAGARELKKSLMRHLFTYGPVPADRTDQVPMQETELGPVPAHWRVVRLGEVGEIVTGKTPPTSNDEYWDGTIPFITPVDLDGRPIVCASRTISKKGLTKTKSLPRNSVLVSCIGYIGKTGLVDIDLATTNQQINAIIPHKEIASSLYLLYVLTYLAPNLAARARMTTVPILSKSGLSAFLIPLPPLPEQQEIARILQAVDEKIRAEEARQAALEGLFRSLLHHLMRAKIRLPREFVQQFDGGSHVAV